MEGNFGFSPKGSPYSYSDPKFIRIDEYGDGAIMGLFQQEELQL